MVDNCPDCGKATRGIVLRSGRPWYWCENGHHWRIEIVIDRGQGQTTRVANYPLPIRESGAEIKLRRGVPKEP